MINDFVKIKTEKLYMIMRLPTVKIIKGMPLSTAVLNELKNEEWIPIIAIYNNKKAIIEKVDRDYEVRLPNIQHLKQVLKAIIEVELD